MNIKSSRYVNKVFFLVAHPLLDAEGQHRLEQYCDFAKSLIDWITEQRSHMQVSYNLNLFLDHGFFYISILFYFVEESFAKYND